MKKLFVVLCASLFITGFPITSFAAEMPDVNEQEITSTEISPRADEIGYQFKKANGHIYRRLYNFTKNVPLSDWEIVG